jgi:hypothetical protein
MTGHEAHLLARAGELDETSELAMQVIGILGGARAARLDPDALTSLVGTAIGLHIQCGREGVYISRHNLILGTLAPCLQLIPWHRSSSERWRT